MIKIKLKIAEHNDYKKLGKEKAISLYQEAKHSLKVGYEIEMNYSNNQDNNEANNENLLKELQKAFKKRYGFEMAIGKGKKAKKILKRVFTDNLNNKIDIPLTIEVDGYQEHLLIPYGYVDGSVPIELVSSPVYPTISSIKGLMDKVHKVVEEVEPDLIPNCLNNCGLHQTVVFEHLATHFPDVVVANTIQIIRTFTSGFFYLLSSGTAEKPSRDLNYRNFNKSVWKTHFQNSNKYSLVYSRYKNYGDKLKCWGIEFRYPDGTLSNVLASVMGVINTAVVLKAIKLSEYGVIEISNSSYRQSKATVNNLICGSLDKAEDYAKENVTELLHFLCSEILELDKTAYAVLEKLKDNPLWKRVKTRDMITRETYNKIDKKLLKPSIDNDTLSNKLSQLIILDNSKKTDMKNTTRRLAKKLNLKYAEVTELLSKNNYIWSNEMGKYMLAE